MKRIQSALRAVVWTLLAGCSQSTSAPVEEGGVALFVGVHIPEPLTPLQRGAKYEDPLDAALQAQGLGEVTGGGTALGPRKADGTQDILAVDVDVELSNSKRGLPALRSELKKLQPPPGTELSYESQGKQVREPLR